MLEENLVVLGNLIGLRVEVVDGGDHAVNDLVESVSEVESPSGIGGESEELLGNSVWGDTHGKHFGEGFSVGGDVDVAIELVVELREVRLGEWEGVDDDGWKLQSSTLGDDLSVVAKGSVSSAHSSETVSDNQSLTSKISSVGIFLDKRAVIFWDRDDDSVVIGADGFYLVVSQELLDTFLEVGERKLDLLFGVSWSEIDHILGFGDIVLFSEGGSLLLDQIFDDFFVVFRGKVDKVFSLECLELL